MAILGENSQFYVLVSTDENIQQMAKVICQKPHHICWENWDPRHILWVSKSPPQKELNQFSCTCTAKSFDRQTDTGINHHNTPHHMQLMQPNNIKGLLVSFSRQ